MVRVVTESAGEALAVVVGKNCRRIRVDAGVTQNVLAKHARDKGLRWTASKVGDFEVGRTMPTFATVLLAAGALAAATQTDVQLADLVESDGFVTLSDSFDPTGHVLRALIRGERSWDGLIAEEVGHYKRMIADPDFRQKMREALGSLGGDAAGRYPDVPLKEWHEILRRSGVDEERLAKKLEISADLLAAVSWTLWRRSFSDERDRLAGPDANAQKRGRISRTLQVEIQKELNGGDD
jgi:hypothetical protein